MKDKKDCSYFLVNYFQKTGIFTTNYIFQAEYYFAEQCTAACQDVDPNIIWNEVYVLSADGILARMKQKQENSL